MSDKNHHSIYTDIFHGKGSCDILVAINTASLLLVVVLSQTKRLRLSPPYSISLFFLILMRIFWSPTDTRTKAGRAQEKAPAVLLWLAPEQTKVGYCEAVVRSGPTCPKVT